MATPPLPRGVARTPVIRTANRLHSAAIHLLRWVRLADRESGLTPERLSVLSILVFAGPRTVGELAELEMISAPAVSRTLNGLEESGLVTRERDDSDRRVVRVIATAKGRRLMDGARARRLRRMAVRLEGLEARELAVLEAAASILERQEERS
jgi:DNA-binding MarR family transcriptional regulator